MTVDPLATLETSIGHQFADRNILHEALSHSSHIDSKHSYERLEFLGDRVMDQNGTTIVFEEFASSRAGMEASKLRHAPWAFAHAGRR